MSTPIHPLVVKALRQVASSSGQLDLFARLFPRDWNEGAALSFAQESNRRRKLPVRAGGRS